MQLFIFLTITFLLIAMPRQLLRLKHVALAFLVYVFVSSLGPLSLPITSLHVQTRLRMRCHGSIASRCLPRHCC